MKMQTAIVALIVALSLQSCSKKKETTQETTVVGKVDLRDAIRQTGEVRPITSVAIKSEASGKIESIHVKAGQLVHKGDVLIEIDPRQIRISLKRLDLEVQRTKLELASAKRSYDDAVHLQSSGTVSSRQIADLKLAMEMARITLKQKQLDLNETEEQLKRTTVRSPIDGVVTTLDVKEGEIAVSATESSTGGTALATVADVNSLEVVAQIGEADFTKIRQGQRVVIRPEASEGVEARGTVTFIAKAATKKEGSPLGAFQVLVSVDSIVSGIASGVSVNVEFLLLEKTGVLGIPCEYITTKEGKSTVTIAPKDAKAEPEERTVVLGKTDYRNSEVISGVTIGETLVRPSDQSTSMPPAE